MTRGAPNTQGLLPLEKFEVALVGPSTDRGAEKAVHHLTRTGLKDFAAVSPDDVDHPRR